jgi:general secretion pathway protein H
MTRRHCRSRPAAVNKQFGFQQGFSLLEIMIVVVIVGIMISLATLSIGSVSDDGIDEHSRRFQILLELVTEEAGIRGRELGLRFYQHGYEFSAQVLEVDEEGVSSWIWVPLGQDRLLKPRNFGEDITLDLEIEGEEVTLEYERDTEQTYVPQVFILSSGDIAPAFMVRIRPTFASDGITLAVNELGTVEMSRDEF